MGVGRILQVENEKYVYRVIGQYPKCIVSHLEIFYNTCREFRLLTAIDRRPERPKEIGGDGRRLLCLWSVGYTC